MVKIKRISSVALTVSDIDRSQNFYTHALGFELVDDITFNRSSYSNLAAIPPSRVRIATLQLGNEFVELIQYLDLEAKTVSQDAQANDLWFQHLAIVVKDMDRAYKHLKRFVIESISTEPQTMPDSNPLAAGVKAFKFRDVDHHSLELIWFPEGKGKAKWQQDTDNLFLGIDHSAIAVADTEASLKFYRDLLGMKVLGSSLSQGEVQAHLDGLPLAEVRVTSLQSAQDSINIELLDYIKPKTGRSRPNNWQINDLTHLHSIAEVEYLESNLSQLQQHGIKIISPNIVKLPNSCYPQGLLIEDPQGHSILLVDATQPFA